MQLLTSFFLTIFTSVCSPLPSSLLPYFCCCPSAFLHPKKKLFVESACVLLFPGYFSHQWAHFPRSVLFCFGLSPTFLWAFFLTSTLSMSQSLWTLCTQWLIDWSRRLIFVCAIEWSFYPQCFCFQLISNSIMRGIAWHTFMLVTGMKVYLYVCCLYSLYLCPDWSLVFGKIILIRLFLPLDLPV